MGTIINDFTINIATANGTGSQSANLILLQSLFDMGVPVSGKNLFPSNISGLPTWYIVRLSDKGYQAPGDRTHIQVLVNPATWDDDLAALEPGSVVVWNSDTKGKTVERDDVVSYPVPMSSLARKINPKIAKLVTNIVYVGVLAELLGIDQTCLESAVAKQFKGRHRPLNSTSRRLAWEGITAKRNLPRTTPMRSRHGESRNLSFSLKATKRQPSAPITAASNSWPGTPLRPPHPLLKASSTTSHACEPTTMEKPRWPSFKPKTSSLLPAWCSEQVGPADAA